MYGAIQRKGQFIVLGTDKGVVIVVDPISLCVLDAMQVRKAVAGRYTRVNKCTNKAMKYHLLRLVLKAHVRSAQLQLLCALPPLQATMSLGVRAFACLQ